MTSMSINSLINTCVLVVAVIPKMETTTRSIIAKKSKPFGISITYNRDCFVFVKISKEILSKSVNKKYGNQRQQMIEILII